VAYRECQEEPRSPARSARSGMTLHNLHTDASVKMQSPVNTRRFLLYAHFSSMQFAIAAFSTNVPLTASLANFAPLTGLPAVTTTTTTTTKKKGKNGEEKWREAERLVKFSRGCSVLEALHYEQSRQAYSVSMASADSECVKRFREDELPPIKITIEGNIGSFQAFLLDFFFLYWRESSYNVSPCEISSRQEA
jgi:hypothetical protein